MKNISLTYQGIAIMLVGFILKAAGTPFVDGDIETFVNVGISLFGAVLAFYGRWRKGDLNLFGFRKVENKG